ncbi:hypothetical protein ACFSCZ_01035 [Siminovitchia sediminis]|uniref:Uncharacterized protein n=1 Tax=Siminovitchia sediminis TaxID=1274353 RepID=A0ABW4KD44_9BACI
MWVCIDHLKEAVNSAKAPYLIKPRCRMRCSLCEKDAIVKLFDETVTLQYQVSRKAYVE